MNFDVVVTNGFKKDFKKLVRKYKSLKIEVFNLVQTLEVNPQQGTSLGNDCYKIRLSIMSKGRGKSGGARVITCVKIFHNTVYLLSIYDKSKKNDLAPNELKEILKKLGLK